MSGRLHLIKASGNGYLTPGTCFPNAQSASTVGWRRAWLDLHSEELAQVRTKRPDWVDNIQALAEDSDLET